MIATIFLLIVPFIIILVSGEKEWRKELVMVLIKSDSPSVFMPWICYICTGGMEWLPLEISKINCSINPADLFWTLSNKCQDFSSSKYFWRTVCNVWLQTAVMLARVKYCTKKATVKHYCCSVGCCSSARLPSSGQTLLLGLFNWVEIHG